MINYNLPRRIATHIEDIVMKPFYFIEEKVRNNVNIKPFGFIWNIAHTPGKISLWIHFHIIRRDQLAEHLERQQRYKVQFAAISQDIQNA